MARLALRTLRHRAPGFTAGFLAMFLGATILMAFASLLDTRAQPGASGGKTLVIMASVVGGWGLVIVSFAVSATLGLLIRQRAGEMALLKNIGAAPGQIGRMIVGESLVVGLVAVAAAIVPAVLTGRLLVGLLHDTHQLPVDVDASFGPIALGMGGGSTVLAALAGAALAARAATRGQAVEALRDAEIDARPARARIVIGVGLVVAGLSCAVVTLAVLDKDAYALMAVAGEGAILSSIGLALLSPVLLRALFGPLARLLRPAGVGGHLTAIRLRRQSGQAAGELTPIILFTGIATGTLSMQISENAVPKAIPHDIARTIETLNYVVVGMIVVFAAVMLVNTLVAATLARRHEFGQLRLTGSTRPQVLGMTGLEGMVLATAGMLLGSLAAAVTAVPYSLVKTGSVLPGAAVPIHLGVIALATVLTLGAALGATRRATRRPALEAVLGKDS